MLILQFLRGTSWINQFVIHKQTSFKRLYDRGNWVNMEYNNEFDHTKNQSYSGDKPFKLYLEVE